MEFLKILLDNFPLSFLSQIVRHKQGNRTLTMQAITNAETKSITILLGKLRRDARHRVTLQTTRHATEVIEWQKLPKTSHCSVGLKMAKEQDDA